MTDDTTEALRGPQIGAQAPETARLVIADDYDRPAVWIKHGAASRRVISSQDDPVAWPLLVAAITDAEKLRTENARLRLALEAVETSSLKAERDELMRASFAAYRTSGADTDGDEQWHCTPEWAGEALLDAVTTLRRDHEEALDELDAAETERDEARAAHAALLADVEALREEYAAAKRAGADLFTVRAIRFDLADVIAKHAPKEAER